MSWQINNLLYVDDISILSLTSDGLQNSLDKLYVYLIFSTTGRLLRDGPLFFIGGGGGGVLPFS